MKKIYLSLLSVMSVISLNAQLTQANQAPSPGDTYSMYRCDSVGPGNAGAAQLWDFSTVITHSNIVANFSSIAATYTDYPGASIAVFSNSTDVSYYHSDVNSLHYFGGNFGVGTGITAVAGNAKYTSAAIRMAYPMSLNTTSSTAISGTINVTAPLPATGSFTGTSSVIADGTGTLVLPGSGNTFANALRVKSSQAFTFTTSIANGTVQQEYYEYYVQGYKFPMFTIATATANTPLGSTTQTIVLRDKSPGFTSIQKQTIDNGVTLNVYPNPATTQVHFSTGSSMAKFVSVFDITGKLVSKLNLEDGKAKLDVSNLQEGLYLYTLNSSDQKILKTGKLTVSH